MRDVQRINKTYHFRFDKGLECVDFAIVLALHQLDLAERTLADDLERGEVLRSFLGPQESKELDLVSSHGGFLLHLHPIRYAWFFQNGF